MWVWIAWGFGALVVWVVVGALLGVVIGRVIRSRNHEVPRDDAPVPAPRPAVSPRERP